MNPFDAKDGIVVAPVGKTREHNLRSGVFCDARPFQARFIGLYDKKEIFAVGLIETVFERHRDGRIVANGGRGVCPPGIEGEIKEMASRFPQYAPKSVSKPCYFYTVRSFPPTSLKKSTKYGVPRTRVFSVSDLTGQRKTFEDAEALSAALKDTTHPLGGKQK